MGNNHFRSYNATSLSSLAKESLRLISRLLVYIGKPVFFAVSSLIVVILYLVYGIRYFGGKFTKFSAKSIADINKRKIYIVLTVNPKTTTLKSHYRLATIISKLNQLPKILLLKMQLFVIKFTSSLLKAKRTKHKFLNTLLISLLVVIVFASTFIWSVIFSDLPSPSLLSSKTPELSTKIYDRNGILLYKIYQNQNRTLVALSDIPRHVINATLAAEDAEFYSHPGFSLKGISRALYRNVTLGELSGGSTITQQLVKNTLLTSEKSLIRKIKEIILAVATEYTYTKDQILEMYLNQVSYGGVAYGIEEASEVYFGKSVTDLTLAESSFLAGLPKSPTKYSPYGSDPQNAVLRQHEVLHLMTINKFITENEEDTAISQKIVIATPKIDIKAPHFVMYVKEMLEEKYGKNMVEKGGLEVVTTLDYQIQKLAEEVVASEVDKLKGLNVGNGAAVVVNPQTGEVLAMVGSKNYFDIEANGNVNVATTLQQPGSSIKVVNYAYALSHNYTAVSILEDAPITFRIKGLPPYTPKNYDSRFRGKLTLRSALAESRNVPAVKVLASYGVDKMIEQGRLMGITTWNNPSDYGLSLTLGGGEIKLVDLAAVYSTIANYGKKPNLNPIITITNSKNKILEENGCASVKGELKDVVENEDKLIVEAAASESAVNLDKSNTEKCNQQQVVDPGVAYIITDILRDNLARSPAFGRNSLLNIAGHPEIAVKTGTSNDLRDNLAIGYNQNYLVAVWVGNNDNSPMARIASGVTGATPIFNKIMTGILGNTNLLTKTDNAWPVPDKLVQLKVCTYTGTLACAGCSNKVEWFLEENKPQKTCNPEYIQQLREERERQQQTNSGLPAGGQGEILEPAASTAN